jgi:integrase
MTQSKASATPHHRLRVPVKGHPGIYRKGDRYQVRWRHHGHERTRSFRLLSEASRFKAKVLSGDTQATSREPFRRYAEQWIEDYSGRTAGGVSEATRQSYRDALERFAVPFFKTTPLDRIDPPMLRRYIRHLATKHNLAPSSVRRVYAPVRALLATAYEDGLLRTNPALGVRVVVKDRRPRVPKWLTAEQTRNLLDAMPTKDADLAYFLAATGCRISEALDARWRDVQPDEDGRIVLSIPKAKTLAGIRTIPLSPETVRRLTKRRSEARFAATDDPIFPSAVGTPMDAHDFRRRVFRPAAERAGVPWATPHKLRHGLASLMANRGYSPAQIASHLGHADGGVLALRTYVHADALDDASFVDEALSDSSGEAIPGEVAEARIGG